MTVVVPEKTEGAGDNEVWMEILSSGMLFLSNRGMYIEAPPSLTTEELLRLRTEPISKALLAGDLPPIKDRDEAARGRLISRDSVPLGNIFGYSVLYIVTISDGQRAMNCWISCVSFVGVPHFGEWSTGEEFLG